ncbi:hypothetical protein HJFPF1_13175 [Paramyrothecium foliicola]|nr:hypothetical protein HJFPF1_13175 [Paramyrothecium foliicola]
MGNAVSQRGTRRCGLCYFALDKNAPFLQEPIVTRRALPIYPTSPWTDGALDDVFHAPEDIYTVQSKTQLQALHMSSERGCAGCAGILECLQNQLDHKGLLADDKSLQGPCRLTWLVGDRDVFNPSLQLEVFVRKATGGNHKNIELSILIGFDSSKAPHPAARKVNRATAEGDTGSTASLNVLKTWLKECDASHQACKQPSSSLPYRVLQLQRDSRGEIHVNLVEDLSSKEPYACLSHRWGASTLRCRTLKSTIQAYFKSVPWSELPLSFQQACAVTLHLGLKYIWIDSLCIIQDDKEDWKIQAAEMCRIYRGSYITIAATCSSDSDQGLFRKVLKFRIPTKASGCQAVFIREAPDHQFGGEYEEDDVPLLSRGWVYQERLLAPRVVHFTRSELHFEDISPHALCECGMETSWPRKETHHRSLAITDLAEVRNHWHEIVGQFSTLNLTYYSDYLPALAGIARQYGTAHQGLLGRYVAGLWEKSLVYDLLWYVGDGYNSQRPGVCNAPTWSWASTTAGTGGMLRYSRSTKDLEVVSSHVQLAGPDEYGPIDAAKITVRGYLIPGSWKWAADKAGNERIHFCSGLGLQTHYIHLDYNFSIPGNSRYISEAETLYCLKTGFVGDGCHVCLILRSVKEDQSTFERVGLLIETPKTVIDGWFEKQDTPQVITLV